MNTSGVADAEPKAPDVLAHGALYLFPLSFKHRPHSDGNVVTFEVPALQQKLLLQLSCASDPLDLQHTPISSPIRERSPPIRHRERNLRIPPFSRRACQEVPCSETSPSVQRSRVLEDSQVLFDHSTDIQHALAEQKKQSRRCQRLDSNSIFSDQYRATKDGTIPLSLFVRGKVSSDETLSALGADVAKTAENDEHGSTGRRRILDENTQNSRTYGIQENNEHASTQEVPLPSPDENMDDRFRPHPTATQPKCSFESENGGVEPSLKNGELPDSIAKHRCPPRTKLFIGNNRWIHSLIMALVVGLQVTFNIDNGVVPAVLGELTREYGIDNAQQGLLGALPHLGLVLLSPFCTRLLQIWSPKWVLVSAIALNAGATFLFAFAPNGIALLLSRFFIGITQAAFIIYAPVWIDEFAPTNRSTLWMGLSQGSTVVGTMLGYLFAGFLRGQQKDWRLAVYVQCGTLVVLLIGYACIKPTLLDVNFSSDRTSPPSIPHEDQSTGLSGDGDSILVLPSHQNLPHTFVHYDSYGESSVNTSHRPQSAPTSSVLNPFFRRDEIFPSLDPVLHRSTHTCAEATDKYKPEMRVAHFEIPKSNCHATESASVQTDHAYQNDEIRVFPCKPSADGSYDRAVSSGPSETGQLCDGCHTSRLIPFAVLPLQAKVPCSISTNVEPSANLIAIAAGTHPSAEEEADSLESSSASNSPAICANKYTDTASQRLNLKVHSTAIQPPANDPLDHDGEADLNLQSNVTSEDSKGRNSGNPQFRSALRGSIIRSMRCFKVLPPFIPVPYEILNCSSQISLTSSLHMFPKSNQSHFSDESNGRLDHCNNGEFARVPHSSLNTLASHLPQFHSNRKPRPQNHTVTRANVFIPQPNNEIRCTPNPDAPCNPRRNKEDNLQLWTAPSKSGYVHNRHKDVNMPGEYIRPQVGKIDGDRECSALSYQLRSQSIQNHSSEEFCARPPNAALIPEDALMEGRHNTPLSPDKSLTRGSKMELRRETTCSNEGKIPVTPRMVLNPSRDEWRRCTVSVVPRSQDNTKSEVSAVGGTSTRLSSQHTDHQAEPGINKETTNVSVRLSVMQHTDSLQENRGQNTATYTPWNHLKNAFHSKTVLLRNPIYVLVVGSLCSLFFELTGIQFWSTKYLEQELQASTTSVLISFSVTAATAPLLGLLFGGMLVDWTGGYRTNQQLYTTLLLLCGLALLSVVFGTVASTTTSFAVCVAGIWFVLLLGGGIVPAAVGILLASVKPEQRTSASGFSLVLYTTLGYMLGTFLPGIFNDIFGLSAGMKVVLLWAIFGLVELVVAALIVRKRWHQELSTNDQVSSTPHTTQV